MKSFLSVAVVLAAFFAIPATAHAGDNIADRTAAIQLCRAEVTSQAGGEANSVRLDQVRVRPSNVRVDFDVWRDGNLQNVRCDVTRGEAELVIASITPALQTASTGASGAAAQ